MPQFFNKKAASTRNFTIDWSEFLDGFLPSVVTIASVSWSVPSGLTTVASSNTTTTATIKLSGGTEGNCEYPVVCTITMSDGQIEPATIYISIV